jgi:hypothetical protein
MISELKSDREVVMKAVSNNGRALEYAKTDLKSNREVSVLANCSS